MITDFIVGIIKGAFAVVGAVVRGFAGALLVAMGLQPA